MVVPFIAAVAAATGASIIAAELGKKGGEQVAGVSEYGRQLAANKKVSGIIESERQKVAQKYPSVGAFGYTLSSYDWGGAQALTGSELSQNVYNRMIKEGFARNQALEVSKTVAARTIGGGAGEAVGYLGVGTTSATIASRSAAKSLARQGITTVSEKKLGVVLSKEAALAGVKGGFYEGAASQVVSDVARNREIKPEGVLLSGGLGAATGGGAGYALGRVWGSKKLSTPTKHFIDIVGQESIDLYEKPTDWLSAGIYKSPRVKVSNGKTISTKVNVFTMSPPSPSITTGALMPSLGSFNIMPSLATTATTATTATDTGTTTPTDTGTTTDTGTETTTEQPTIATDTQTGVTVPNPTPMLRNVPPLPLPLFGSDTGRGSGRGSRDGRYWFYNEIGVTKKLLKHIGGI